MTMVEVMTAMVILIIGVLGTLVLVEGSMSSTSRTTAREQGTNLARDLVERSRQADYDDVSMAGAPGKLRGTLPTSDGASAVTGSPPDSTFTVTRRGVVYTVKVFACSIDDPSDGAGQGNATFCESPSGPPAGGPGGPPPAPAPAASLNVLGIDITVTVGGTLLNTVCSAIGTNTDIAQADWAPSPAWSTPRSSVCPGAEPTPATLCRWTPTPDDLRRVRIDVCWNRGGAGSVTQTTLLPNPFN